MFSAATIGSLPRILVGDYAAEMDDAVAHDDIEAERAPVVLLECLNDTAANVVVIGRRIGNFAGEACNRLQQVGARHDPDKLVAVHHRQALDVVGFHRSHDFLQASHPRRW